MDNIISSFGESTIFFICVYIGWWTMTDEGGYGGICNRRSCSCNTNKQLLTNYHQGHGTESLQSWNNQTGKWANRSWRRNKNRHQSSERTEGKANKSIALVSKLGQTLLKWKINNAIGNSSFFQNLIQSKFRTSTDPFHCTIG